MDDAERQDWLSWCTARAKGVQGVPGNLALTSYQPVTTTPTPVECIPGATVRREPGREGVVVAASPDLGVTVDGALVAGESPVGRSSADAPNLIHWDRYWIDVFSLDGTDHELRIYDEKADNLANFDGIEVYEYDPDARFTGRFDAFDSVDRVAWEFTRAADTGHTKKVSGTIVADIGGRERRLSAFLDGSDLVLVFADATTGVESYAPGRFLRMPAPGSDGSVVLDFNRAIVPPCGFSDFYSCPMPPAQNRLDVPIRAGEKGVLWKRPRYA